MGKPEAKLTPTQLRNARKRRSKQRESAGNKRKRTADDDPSLLYSSNPLAAPVIQSARSFFRQKPFQIFLGEMTKKISKVPLYPDKSYVLLSTGEIAIVVGHRKDLYTLRPIVEIFFNPKKGKNIVDKFFKHPIQIDLDMDSRRYIVKKILSPDYINKFDEFLSIERKIGEDQSVFTTSA